MSGTFAALVAETADPGRLVESVRGVVDGQVTVERRRPRDPGERRVRVEGAGWFHESLREGIESGRVRPVEWAVVLVALDVGVDAWVYDGATCIDAFQGEAAAEGADAERYLERYHGVVVAAPGPSLPPTDGPRTDLADVEPPDRTLDPERPDADRK